MAKRPQYIRERCGACGKKMAWGLRTLGFQVGPLHDVQCLSCKAEMRFCERQNDAGIPVWPGTLEKAAAALTAIRSGETP